MTESDDDPMDTFLGGELAWNDFTPDEQALIGYGIAEAAKLRPDMLTKEELEDIARFVRFAQSRKAGQEGVAQHG